MDIHFLSLTVCFEPPFWVGVFERDRARRTIRQPGHIRCRAERLRGMGLRPEARLSTQNQPIYRRRPFDRRRSIPNGTANAAQADRPRPDRHKIAAGFAAPARCIQTGAENVHAGAAGDRKTAPFRAAAAETKGNAPGALISGAFSLLRCALNFRRSGCRGR